jgi:hypothetical protein
MNDSSLHIRESDKLEIPESHQIALAHRIAVIKAGRFVLLLIICTSVYGAWSSQWYLIAVGIVSGLPVMVLVSFQSASKVKKLTGLSQAEQVAIWELYNS